MRTLLVLGGGYGGLALIQELLNNHLPQDIEIILIDRMPYQGIKTEYYALAAGTVTDYHLRIQFPVHPRLTIRYGEVSSIDLESRIVTMEPDETVSYDILAIALGCTDNYHNIPGADQYTCSIQTFAGTRETYQRLNDVKPYGTINIVGGGLSGVELAAELREADQILILLFWIAVNVSYLPSLRSCHSTWRNGFTTIKYRHSDVSPYPM